MASITFSAASAVPIASAPSAPVSPAAPPAIRFKSGVICINGRVPVVINESIASYLDLILSNIKYSTFPKTVRDYVCLSRVNKTIQLACQDDMRKIKSIWSLIKKYINKDIGGWVPDAHDSLPTIISAVSSGFMHVGWMDRAFNTYKEENEREGNSAPHCGKCWV